jgi:hypothetical protein
MPRSVRLSRTLGGTGKGDFCVIPREIGAPTDNRWQNCRSLSVCQLFFEAAFYLLLLYLLDGGLDCAGAHLE